MRIAFWITGNTCVGKSHNAKILAERFGVRVRHLDTVFDRINIDGMTKLDGYKAILKDLKDIAVLDGVVPFNYKEDMDIIQSLLGGYKVIYIIIAPDYNQWIKNVEARKTEIPDSNPKIITKEKYEEYNTALKNRVGKYLEGIEDLSMEDVRNLRYQHDGFTDVKWKQLRIDARGKSLLDLGCSSCQFERLSGADRYTGLDSNLSFLINNNAHRFDLNKLEEWVYDADIVVCSSVIHYIHDKEKFIKECARLAKELFVLEIPLHRGDGKELHLGSRGLYFPTKELLEEWLGKYFESFECLGESIVEDNSYRLIYHCKK